jgi:hypothetical protein
MATILGLAPGTVKSLAPMTLTGCHIAKAIGFRDEFTASSSPSKASAICLAINR